jgi:hypothetical protein
LGESTLRFHGGTDAVGGALKGEEERIALRVDLEAAMLLNGSTH